MSPLASHRRSARFRWVPLPVTIEMLVFGESPGISPSKCPFIVRLMSFFQTSPVSQIMARLIDIISTTGRLRTPIGWIKLRISVNSPWAIGEIHWCYFDRRWISNTFWKINCCNSVRNYPQMWGNECGSNMMNGLCILLDWLVMIWTVISMDAAWAEELR